MPDQDLRSDGDNNQRNDSENNHIEGRNNDLNNRVFYDNEFMSEDIHRSIGVEEMKVSGF